LARLVVPTFADRCAIDLIENNGPVKRITDCTIDARANVLVEQGLQFRPIGEELTQVLESGRASLPVKRRTAVSTENASEPAEGALRTSRLVVPMIAPRVRGAITFAMERSGRSFGQTEIAIGEELGRRAAVAVEHSRLFKEAEEAVQARDDFLSIASHELNTPLTALQLQMDMLLQQVGPEATPLQKRVNLARRQISRISKLIRNLLDVSRISSGKLVLEFEDVDLTEVLREAVERSEETRRRAGSSLQISVPGPVIGRWDRMRIEQVVSNLLTNAIKYGEGKPIEIAVEKGGDAAHLKIRDFGIGIPPEEQPQIFHRFSRAHSAHRYGGFGLGLWIVRQIVDALGGSIEVQSKPEEGSTFVVRLPLSQEAVTAGAKSGGGLAQAR
jgi:signal transduction histidine kinase